MLRIGILGMGFMGRMHYRCWDELDGCEVVAVCDADSEVPAKAGQAEGNIDGAEKPINFDLINFYTDFDQMLSTEKLDAVSITLPTWLHAEFTKKALKAGVHVLCEKPMALNLQQCQDMIEAARSSGKILQIGHCIRFWPEYAKTKEIISSGQYGSVVSATFQRLGTAPSWGEGNWFGDESRSGGVTMDLHIHDTDYVQYILGMPHAVNSFGAKDPSGKNIVHMTTRYDYDDDVLVTAEGSWAMAPSYGFKMSFNIVLEEATIVYDCTSDPVFKICPVKGDPLMPEVASGDGYSCQVAHFAGLIGGKKLPEVISMNDSMDAIKISLAEIESIKKNQPVTI
ncbi:MAG: Gfo/Idh/MocA family oxidoreductase [Phycisphaerae bacterium]|nr:Gfo/Idh/MocA family oxidoreductase [Phycisphaerae bacterium]